MTIRQLTATDLALMEDLLTNFGEAFGEVTTDSASRPSNGCLKPAYHGLDLGMGTGKALEPSYDEVAGAEEHPSH